MRCALFDSVAVYTFTEHVIAGRELYIKSSYTFGV